MSPAVFHERVTSTARLSDLRAAASRWLEDARIEGETIGTVLLVLSETCTNAFIHGGADAVDVEIAVDDLVDGDGSMIAMCIRHQDHDPAKLALPTTMPPPEDAFGRGLAIVERLVDRMTLWIDPPHIVRRLWLRTASASGG